MHILRFSVSVFIQNSTAIDLILDNTGELNEIADFGTYLNLTLSSQLREAWNHTLPFKHYGTSY